MVECILQESFSLSVYATGVATLLIASFSSIFSIANPLAVMPVFLSLTDGDDESHRKRLAQKAALYMFLVLVVFLFGGTFIMRFFGISLPGIRIAGGLLIMRAAFSMLNPEEPGRKISREDEESARVKEDISFSPLAMPLLSGPGSIAVVIGLATQVHNPVDYLVITIAIGLVVLISFALLRAAPWITRFIGKTGMNAMTRMMGFIALAIAVQFILNGISQYFGVG